MIWQPFVSKMCNQEGNNNSRIKLMLNTKSGKEKGFEWEIVKGQKN